MKYKLLSTQVDPRDKKQIYELAFRALESGMHDHRICQFEKCCQETDVTKITKTFYFYF